MTSGDRLARPGPGEAYGGQELHPDLLFMIDFALYAGTYMITKRSEALVSEKLDRTLVTDIDTDLNQRFIEAVRERSGGRATVIGEERSAYVEGSAEEWVIDPVDGTGEYVRTHKDSGEPLEDYERTTCIGMALFKEGRPIRSVVFNPFRNELFVADDELGGAFLNGQPLRVEDGAAGRLPFGPGIPYDYAHWEGAAVDPRFFEGLLGRPPLGDFSAIYQACQVAKGESAFAVFAGNTLHDIGPAAHLVALAGGGVSAPDGQPLRRDALNGAVYSNGLVHAEVIQALQYYGAA